MADFNLDAFLASQQAEGVSQGEGDFTISHEKAAQKMREYSLPREQAWVLKLVQAAISWGCSQVVLKQTRNQSTFHFKFNSHGKLPTNEVIVGNILRANPEGLSAIENLGSALRILVEKLHLSFHLLVDTGVASPQAIYAGVFFSDMGEKKRARHREGWPRGLSLAIYHIPHTEVNRLLLHVASLRAFGLPMMQELEKFAYTCPVPFFIDGRRIDGVLRSGTQKWSKNKRPIRMAGVDIPGDKDPKAPICCGFDNQIFSLKMPLRELLASNGPSPLAECYFVLAVEVEPLTLAAGGQRRRSSLYWVRNGVIVDEHILSPETSMLELTLYAPADGLGVDLTGFQLLGNEEYSERLERICERICRVLRLELEADRSLFGTPESEESDEDEESEFFYRQGPAKAFIGTIRRQIRDGSLQDLPKAIRSGTRAAIEELTNIDFAWNEVTTRSLYRSEMGLLSTSLLDDLVDEIILEDLDKTSAEEEQAEAPVVEIKEAEEPFRWVPPEERT